MARDLLRHPASRFGGADAERLWRVRKQHRHIDAVLLTLEDAPAVELRYFRDDRLLVARRWPAREPALEEAAAKLNELQRAGWTTHW
jgi:hypothetical protein